MNNSKSYIWGLLSRFIPQGIYLITTMILARFLSPEDFGMVGVLAVIFMVANILLDSGLGGSLIHKKEITKLDCSTIGVFNLTISLLIYFILFIYSENIETYFAINNLATVVQTISVVFPITAIGIVPSALLKRSLSFKQIFYSTIIGVLVASMTAIIMAIYDCGVFALVAYQIVVNLVTVVLNFFFSRYNYSFRFSYSCLKELLPFGFFTSVITIVDSIYENLMVTLTGKFLNVQNAGYLYQAKRLEETMSSSLAVAVGIVAFPILTRMKDDIDKFVKEAIKTFNIITLLIFPLLFIVAIFSKEILVFIFGSQWLPAASYLKIFMFCGVFILMEQLIYSFIKSLGRVKKMMYLTFLKRTIGIGLLLFMLFVNPNYLIYAYLVSTIIGFFINLILFSKQTKISPMVLLTNSLYNIAPSFLFYILIIVFENHLSFSVSIWYTVFFLIFYYLLYTKIRGLNIMSHITNLLKS